MRKSDSSSFCAIVKKNTEKVMDAYFHSCDEKKNLKIITFGVQTFRTEGHIQKYEGLSQSEASEYRLNSSVLRLSNYVRACAFLNSAQAAVDPWTVVWTPLN